MDFSGGNISSDAGAILLGALDERRGIVRDFSRCFRDHRNPDLIEHSVEALLRQRIFGIALGYEDLNDHDQLRSDPLLALAVGKDPAGNRRRESDRGRALAGKSTLHRLEGSAAKERPGEERYQRFELDADAAQRFFTATFLRRPRPSKPLILDLDATDDPIHGNQEGRFFHGYFGNYCYLPLYIFCGESLLWAQLRSANIDACAGSLEAVTQIVAQIRRRWPRIPILLRADSGFTREPLMAWCEANGVDFLFGLARNSRLEGELAAPLEQAAQVFKKTGKAARIFAELSYKTVKTWSRERRVVGKAEYLAKGANPRFMVTSLKKQRWSGRKVHQLYCQRGDMENRIKEQQLGLFADRTSAHWLKVNQLRLFFSSVAYVLLAELRRLVLSDTDLAKAQVGTLRLQLLKIGALIKLTVRRIWISCSSAYPMAPLWLRAFARVQGLSSA